MLRSAFKRVYALIPLHKETVEFFADSARTILHLLTRRNFVLASVKGKCSLVAPSEVVRPVLPTGVDAHLTSDVKRELEAVLNRGRRYLPSEALSGTLAAALNIHEVDDNIAFEALSRLSREDAAARPRSDAELGLLQLLFHVMAVSSQPTLLKNLVALAVIPTESGTLHPAQGKLYMVDEDTARTIRGYAEGVSLRFRSTMHEKVKALFQRMGVQQTDGARFLREILVPMLTADTAPEIRQLVSATQSVRAICATMKPESSLHKGTGQV